MSLSKLTKRLRREVTASPKKAAILGLLAVVAMYFWMPLLKNMIVKQKTAPEPSAEAPAELADTGPGFAAMVRGEAAGPTPENETPPQACCWEDLVGWLKEDAATRPAGELARRRSPFSAVRVEPEEADLKLEEEKPMEPVLTPGSLGMELTGTVVGPGRRVAVIDGKAYTQGHPVALVKDGRPIEFTLAEVHSERIVLERLGQRYELAIPPRATLGHIEPVHP